MKTMTQEFEAWLAERLANATVTAASTRGFRRRRNLRRAEQWRRTMVVRRYPLPSSDALYSVGRFGGVGSAK